MNKQTFGGFLRRVVLVGAVASGSLLVACGGGGAGGQGGAGSVTGASSAASIQLVTDKTALLTDGSVTATITAIVKDASNSVLQKQGVALSSSDATTTLTPGATPQVTDASGKVTATLQLQVSGSASKVNRTVTVTAVSGSISQTLQIPINGTSLAIDGNATVAQSAAGTYTVTLKDGGGNLISGAAVTASTKNGNTVSPAQATTDGSGSATFVLTGTTAGSDELTVSSLNASASKTVTVSAAAAVTGLTISPATLNVPVNTASGAVKVVYTINSVPQANQALVLALTRGVFSSCTISSGNSCTTINATTDGAGAVSVAVQSPTAGSSTLTGFVQSDPTLTSNASLQFFSPAANATKISVSSSISSVGINASGVTANNKSVITAVVRDATDNPVKGATVLFTANADPSGGSLSPATAVTDATGAAATTFTPGGTSTGPNAVVLQAAVASNSALSSRTQLTVSQVALFVDLGTGNSISAKDVTSYQMSWTAIVTDASSAASTGQTVTASMSAAYDGDTSNPTLKYYYKGVWKFSSGAWTSTGFTYAGGASGNPQACLNEDVNHNNILDATEDKNGNGKLDPGSPSSVLVGGVTDSNGNAPLTVTYPKSFGGWVNVSLKATISTSGTQSLALRTFLLPLLAGDVSSATVAPPNVGATIQDTGGASYLKGPYGADPTTDGNGFCTSPN